MGTRVPTHSVSVDPSVRRSMRALHPLTQLATKVPTGHSFLATITRASGQFCELVFAPGLTSSLPAAASCRDCSSASLERSRHTSRAQLVDSRVATIRPSQNIRIVPDCDSAIATTPSCFEMEAAAKCRAPSPNGRSTPSADTSRYRQAATTVPSSARANAPSNCASSLMVPRSRSSVIDVEPGACPARGSRMSAREQARTASGLPIVKSVPTR